jgi:hypothetical protein
MRSERLNVVPGVKSSHDAWQDVVVLGPVVRPFVRPILRQVDAHGVPARHPEPTKLLHIRRNRHIESVAKGYRTAIASRSERHSPGSRGDCSFHDIVAVTDVSARFVSSLVVDTHGMSFPRALLAGLASLRAFLLAFIGSLGWLIWSATQETSSSCYSTPHYLLSDGITFAVIILLTVASRRPWRERSTPLLIGEGLAAAGWSGLGLFIVTFLALAASCSA